MEDSNLLTNRSDHRFMLSRAVFFLNTITRTVDISMGGMQIKVDGNSVLRDDLSIGMELDDELYIQFYGRPIWCRDVSPEQHIYGIKFIELSKTTRHTLEQFLHLS